MKCARKWDKRSLALSFCPVFLGPRQRIGRWGRRRRDVWCFFRFCLGCLISRLLNCWTQLKSLLFDYLFQMASHLLQFLDFGLNFRFLCCIISSGLNSSRPRDRTGPLNHNLHQPSQFRSYYHAALRSFGWPPWYSLSFSWLLLVPKLFLRVL